VHTPNVSGSPIVEVPLDDADDLDVVGRLLWDAGIYVTLAAYPLVPRASVGFRVQLTAANSDEEVDELLAAITALAERSLLQTSRNRGADALSGSPTLPRRVQDRGTPRSR
jgi:selenocysteine lyase/cysteine desulfurase